MSKPLITSNLWNDYYTWTQFQMIFNQFPFARARYKVQDRQIDRPYPDGMNEMVREQLDMLHDVRTTRQEYDFLMRQRITKPTCAEYFLNYQFDPNEVETYYDKPIIRKNYKEVATIESWMYRGIWWEMPMISISTMLRMRGLPKKPGWKDRITEKNRNLYDNKMNWLDGGTRRAFDMETQSEVVNQSLQYYVKDPTDATAYGWRGTSNMRLAMENDVMAQGTISHQSYMLMQAAYGFRMSNPKTTEHWIREYGGDLGIALPDTLTTDVFLKSFERLHAQAWKGTRLDSGDLIAAAMKWAAKMRSYDIDPLSKLYIPSNGLTDKTAIAFRDELDHRLGGKSKTNAMLGTYMVNDVGYDPSAIVCKLDAVQLTPQDDWVSVVKLSDELGKDSGDPSRAVAARAEVGA